jgi:hypothetical protein
LISGSTLSYYTSLSAVYRDNSATANKTENSPVYLVPPQLATTVTSVNSTNGIKLRPFLQKLEDAHYKLAEMIVNRQTYGIPIFLEGVNTTSISLDIGIDRSTPLTKDEYHKRLVAILGDVPMNVFFGNFSRQASTANNNQENTECRGIPSLDCSCPLYPIPPLGQQTMDGKYSVKLSWTSTAIMSGNTTYFVLTIHDDTGLPVLYGNCHMVIKDANGTIIRDFGIRKVLDCSSDLLPVASSRTGVIHAIVFVYPQDCNNQCADTDNEKTDFGIAIAPEFVPQLLEWIAIVEFIAVLAISNSARLKLGLRY